MIIAGAICLTILLVAVIIALVIVQLARLNHRHTATLRQVERSNEQALSMDKVRLKELDVEADRLRLQKMEMALDRGAEAEQLIHLGWR